MEKCLAEQFFFLNCVPQPAHRRHVAIKAVVFLYIVPDSFDPDQPVKHKEGEPDPDHHDQ